MLQNQEHFDDGKSTEKKNDNLILKSEIRTEKLKSTFEKKLKYIKIYHNNSHLDIIRAASLQKGGMKHYAICCNSIQHETRIV